MPVTLDVPWSAIPRNPSSKPKRPRKPKDRGPEYDRGFRHGLDAGTEMRAKYGRAFADHQADVLARSARRRDADVFDKGYALGYQTALK
jgi:hypothetical protein